MNRPTIVLANLTLPPTPDFEVVCRKQGYAVCTLESPEQIADLADDDLFCVIAEIVDDGRSGLNFQEALERRSPPPPIIFLLSDPEPELIVEACRGGAFDLFVKVDVDSLFQRVAEAFQRAERDRRRIEEFQVVERHLDSLTPRELEVLNRLIQGFSGKQIALELKRSYRTVEKHRANVMRKMQADSLADLVRMVVTQRMLNAD